MKNPFIISSAMLLFAHTAHGQVQTYCRECSCLLEQAESKSKQGQNTEAISLYQAYVVCEPTKVADITQRISKIQEKTESEKSQAKRIAKQAKLSEGKAEKAEKRANEEAKRAGEEARNTRKQARANHNLAVTLRTLQQDPTMAVRMAEFSLDNNPDDIGIQQVYADIMSNTENFFYRRRVFKGHRGDITEMTLSPDGRIILTGGRDSTARIWSQDGRLLHTFESLPGEVAFVYFSPKGRKVLAANASWAMVGDTAGQVLHLVKRPGDKRGSAVAFSPNDEHWVFGDFTGCLRLLTCQGQLLDSFSTNVGRINRVVFSSDGKYVLACGESGISALWNIEKPRKSVHLPGHTAGVQHGAFSFTGDSVVTVGNDNTVRLWNLKGDSLGIITDKSSFRRAYFVGTDSLLLQYEKASSRTPVFWDLKRESPKRFTEVNNLVYYSPRFINNRLLVLSQSKPDSDIPDDGILTVRIFDKDGSYRGRFAMPSKGRAWPELVNTTPEQYIILCFKNGNTFESYQFSNLRPTTFKPKSAAPEEKKQDRYAVPYAAFTPNGSFFAYHLPGDSAATMRGVNYRPSTNPYRLQKEGSVVKTISVNPKLREGSKYAFLMLSFDGAISLFDRDARERWSAENTESHIFYTQFSSDGQRILTLHADSTFQIWNPENNQRRRIGKYPDSLRCAALSPDRATVAVGGSDQRVRFWGIDEQKQKPQILPDLGAPVEEVAFLPDNQRILARTSKGEVSLWNISQTAKPLKTWRRDWSGGVGSNRGWKKAILSPDGKHILLLGYGNTATLTDLKGETMVDLVGHKAPIETAVFSADEKYFILTAGQDNTARLWDKWGKPIAVFGGEQQNGVRCAAISPDGRRALTLDGRGAAYLWKMPKELLENGIEQFSPNELATNDLLPDPERFNFDTVTHMNVLSQTASNFLKQQDTVTAHKLYDYLVKKFDTPSDEVWYKWYLTGKCTQCDWDTLMAKAQPAALYPIAERFKKDKRYKKTQELYEHLIENHEAAAPPLWDYFEVCEASGGNVNKKLFLDETDAGKLVSYAQFFQSEGDSETARNLFKKSLQTQSSVQGIIGLMQMNKTEDQPFIRERISALTDTRDLLLLADHFRENDLDAQAVELYHKILAVEEIPEANIELHKISLSNPNFPFNSERLLQSSSDQALRRYADYFGAEGDTSLIIKLLERIIKIEKADSYDYFERYLLLKSRGSNAFGSLLELGDPSLLRGLMSYFSSQGWFEPDSALQYYQKAAQLGERLIDVEDIPENRESLSRIYNSLGWNSILAGDCEKCEKAIKRGIKVFPDNLYLYTNLPHALLFQGKLEEAKSEYLKYESWPYHPERNRPFIRDAYLADFENFRNDFKKNLQTKFTRKMMDDMAEIEKMLRSLPPNTVNKKG